MTIKEPFGLQGFWPIPRPLPKDGRRDGEPRTVRRCPSCDRIVKSFVTMR